MLYDTSIVASDIQPEKQYISKQDVLRMYSELRIFERYIGRFKIGRPFRSPLREDRHPSFAIFVSKRDNAILYKDLASGDCGDVFKFVKKLYSLTRYSDVYRKIYEDMSGIKIDEPEKRQQKLVYRKNVDISIKRKQLNRSDILFWEKYGISVDILNRYKVNAISDCYINNSLYQKYSLLEPMYSYKVFNKFKIYRPLSQKTDKWRSNLSSLDIQGYEQLDDTTDLLIITKSLKDVMTLRALGYNSIAPPSESSLIPDIVINKLKEKYKSIIVFYDRDKAGMKFARKMVNTYGFRFMFINKKHKTKDISDFVKVYGLEKASKLLLEMIEKS